MSNPSLMSAVTAWVNKEPIIRSAVLFGSSAQSLESSAGPDHFSDIDLHIISPDPKSLERVDWARFLPAHQFAFNVVRPATGGVRKATAIFATGQVDLVLVPERRVKVLRLLMRAGIHHKIDSARIALNEMATCLSNGYRFLKGEYRWGSLYARVAREMMGVRVSSHEARELAEVFLSDFLLMLGKLERGECMAAQHQLHCLLAMTNFKLIREMRLRRGQSLPSFGIARHLESLLCEEELGWVQVSARLNAEELRVAGWRAFEGLKKLMHELEPQWHVPYEAIPLLLRHSQQKPS